jgi:hypothetical protein
VSILVRLSKKEVFALIIENSHWLISVNIIILPIKVIKLILNIAFIALFWPVLISVFPNSFLYII